MVMTHLFWRSWVPWVKSWVRLLVAVKMEAFPVGEQHVAYKKRCIRDVNTVKKKFRVGVFQLTSLTFLVAYISETDRWTFMEG